MQGPAPVVAVGGAQRLGPALELAPGDPQVLRSAGIQAYHGGRFEDSERFLLKSIEQDPLNPAGYSSLGNMYRLMGRWADVEAPVQKTLELAPSRIGVRMMLAVSLSEQGKHEEALTMANAELAEWSRLTALAYVHHLAGRRAESETALRELEAKWAQDSAYQIAAVYAAKGDLDAAFRWLDRAREQRDAGLAMVKYEPVFRSIRNDPRWAALLGAIGLQA